jgi:rhodanese-related sulfurtransferase
VRRHPVLAAAAAALLLVPACETPRGQGRTDIDADEAVRMIEARQGDPSFVILDVRTPEEFAPKHVRGAANVDYSAPGFEDRIAGFDRNLTYLVYCQGGRRSAQAADAMADAGFRTVYNALGGIAAIEQTDRGPALLVRSGGP